MSFRPEPPQPPPHTLSSCLPARPQVHAGFYGAWTRSDFGERVLARIGEIQAGAPGPLRFWVTGGLVGADGWEE